MTSTHPTMPRAIAPPRAPMTERRRETIATIAVVTTLVVLMEILSRFVPDYVMPSPAAVLKAGKEIFFSDTSHVFITLARLTVAVAASMLLGLILGLVMGMKPKVRPYLRSLVVIDTGIPALSWMLIAVFWFKDPEVRIFFILCVIIIPFYALNIYDGIRAMPKELVDMIESFRPSRWHVMRYLIIPHIVPYVFLTTKSVIGYAIRMVVFAELVASAAGIGSRMNLAQSTFRIDQVFAWTFFLVVLNIVLQVAISALEKVALKWRPEVSVR